MCDFDNCWVLEDYCPKRSFTLHQRNVGKGGDIITHWSSGGNDTFDSDCWWCRLKRRFGFGK